MATVLLTGAGGAGGIASIQALQSHTSHEIITVDMNPDSVGFYFADGGQVVPPVVSGDWPEAMADVVSEFEVDVVIPLIDEELPHLPALRDRVPADTRFIAPSSEFVGSVLDKWNMVQAFESHGLEVPNTVLTTDLHDLSGDDFPRIVKPRMGHGAKGVERVSSAEEVREILRESDYDPDELLLQEYIDGTEFTTSVVVSEQNKLLGIVPKETTKPDGTTMHGVTRDSSLVDSSCRRIFETFQPHGPFNVQQMVVEEESTAYTLEINPRFSASSCLTIEAGINEIDLLIRDALGESVREQREFETDLHMFRYLDQIYVSEDELFDEKA